MFIPKPNVEYYWKCFKYVGGKFWNDVPNNIQNVSSVKAFTDACMKLPFKHNNTCWTTKYYLWKILYYFNGRIYFKFVILIVLYNHTGPCRILLSCINTYILLIHASWHSLQLLSICWSIHHMPAELNYLTSAGCINLGGSTHLILYY